MSNLQELETPIDEAIVNALIEATPEWWNAAQLEVVHSERPSGVEGFAHTITSPEGHRDIVSATDELTDATLRLADLFRSHGKIWTKVVYTTTKSNGGKWTYSADFSY